MANTLTEEQKQRTESNRLQAIERLKLKRNANEQTNQTNNDQHDPKAGNEGAVQHRSKRSRPITPYYDYDFSKMVDSKGGYIVEEEKDDRLKELSKDNIKIVPYHPPSIDPTENPKCKECDSMDLDPVFFQVFSINICPICKEKFPEKYSLITKTEAKEDYLLTDPELRDKDLLPHWSKPNPRKSTWNNMMLYVREMVEEYAFKKWGGPEGLDGEYERREAQKKEKKDKKFKDKLADMRRKTMTSSWERKRQEGPHKHKFEDTIEDEDGTTTQTCTECGLVIESEEF
ncbi:DNA-binding transcription regulator [Phycomyces blakesleeanus]|uniref:DNA repair protein RAD14 n=2 Tax=Phycomyces blakesleeanus TaxID=4837 RepID=A0A167QNA6_PHYB8|nr:DNA-binding transcription regulator [Phycomyces blakesleeanus NRRL 1555(-)]OAD79964.1 DNA-binding transcription regulator [Phycomyces blakesleeanus NRRL 1555(-)]|eukprot:XP_018298004.1 DNA-binding transcription regulator [Phycomyces blakesleeanus NRRL 1555(-)]